MNILSVDLEDVYNEYPKTRKWVKTLKKDILDKDVKKKDIFASYTYTFLEESDDEIDDLLLMLYDERLKYEFSKLVVYLTIKVGSVTLTKKMTKNIPFVIVNVIREVTKVKMIMESKVHNDTNIINSIPKIDESIVTIEYANPNSDFIVEKVFNIDDILDKISKYGISSLSSEEKDFLDKSSK